MKPNFKVHKSQSHGQLELQKFLMSNNKKKEGGNA